MIVIKKNRDYLQELLTGLAILIIIIIAITLIYYHADISLINVIFTGIVALATIFYALLTSKLVNITQKNLMAQTEPRIAIYLKTREEFISIIDIFIENLGSGPANQIKINIDNDYEYHPNYKISELGVFKEGIEFLSPECKRVLFTVSALENYDTFIKTKLHFQIKYQDIYGNQYESQSKINFAELTGSYMTGKPPQYKMVDELSGIKKELAALKKRI